MKLTKSRLKQLVKKEIRQLSEIAEPGLATGERGGLRAQVQRLYDEWQPTTPEGQKYKDDLGELLGDEDGYEAPKLPRNFRL
tara:strand:+ start:1233 stop:1478 length:246 start_codon:yes stop_codon:yes gene_type:complete